MAKTALEEALSDAHYEVYKRLLTFTPEEVTRRLAQLDGRPFHECPAGILLQRKPQDPLFPYDPVRKPVDAFELMQRHTVLKEYEPYDSLGDNYYCHNFGNSALYNPIRFFTYQDSFLPQFESYEVNACICLSVLLNKDPEMLKFVQDAYDAAKARIEQPA